MLLGEALALAALVGSLLKADGRLIVQAQGEGPVPLLVAEHGAGGGLRGYARMGRRRGGKLRARIACRLRRFSARGSLVLTLDQGGDRRHIRASWRSRARRSRNARRVISASANKPRRAFALAVGEAFSARRTATWRAGGVLMQRVAATMRAATPQKIGSALAHPVCDGDRRRTARSGACRPIACSIACSTKKACAWRACGAGRSLHLR